MNRQLFSMVCNFAVSLMITPLDNTAQDCGRYVLLYGVSDTFASISKAGKLLYTQQNGTPQKWLHNHIGEPRGLLRVSCICLVPLGCLGSKYCWYYYS